MNTSSSALDAQQSASAKRSMFGTGTTGTETRGQGRMEAALRRPHGHTFGSSFYSGAHHTNTQEPPKQYAEIDHQHLPMRKSQQHISSRHSSSSIGSSSYQPAADPHRDALDRDPSAPTGFFHNERSQTTPKPIPVAQAHRSRQGIGNHDVAIAQLSRQVSQVAGDIATCVHQNELVITLLERLVALTELSTRQGSRIQERAQVPESPRDGAFATPHTSSLSGVNDAASRSTIAHPTPSDGDSATHKQTDSHAVEQQLGSPQQTEVLHCASPGVQQRIDTRLQHQSDPHMVQSLSDTYANLFDFIETPAPTFQQSQEGQSEGANVSSDDLRRTTESVGSVPVVVTHLLSSSVTETARSVQGQSEPMQSVSQDDESDDEQPYETRKVAGKRKGAIDEELGDWTSWRSPYQFSLSDLRTLPQTQYRTADQVRLDRQTQTHRSPKAIGRIPLKQYLELNVDDYRAVRRLARVLHTQWLEPNVRLARQESSRLIACYHRLEHAFPLLSRCEDHWKARELMLQVIDNSIDERNLQKRQDSRSQERTDAPPARKRGRPKGTTAAVLAQRRMEAETGATITRGVETVATASRPGNRRLR